MPYACVVCGKQNEQEKKRISILPITGKLAIKSSKQN